MSSAVVLPCFDLPPLHLRLLTFHSTPSDDASSCPLGCAVRREPDPFEWYQEFGALKHILARYIQKQTVALVVGCGTSLVPEEIAAAGAKSVLAIDFAQTAIDIQKKRHANQQGLQCKRHIQAAAKEAQARRTKNNRVARIVGCSRCLRV